MKTCISIHDSQFTIHTILACLAIFFAACGLAAGADVNISEANIPAELNYGARVAVTVNGVDITESEIEAQIKPQLEKMAAQLPPAFVEQYKKQLRQQVLERMIVELLLDEKVKEAKIVVTDEEVVNRVREMASQQGLSVDDLKALMEAYGKTLDDLKQQVEKGLIYEKLMDEQFTANIGITEKVPQEDYSKNVKEFKLPEQVRASHILIQLDTADPNVDPNEAKAKAKAKTQELLKQIKGGADFAELAKANSSCSSAARGGDLNFFGRGQMAPAFEKAAFALKVGQVSDIVETRFGYHIIKVTESVEPIVISLEEIKPSPPVIEPDATKPDLDPSEAAATAEALIERAEFLANHGRQEVASELFEKALEQSQNPDLRARAIIGIGNFLSSVGSNDEARDLYNQAFALTEDPDVKARILFAQVGLLGEEHLFKEGRAKVNEALRLSTSPETKSLVLMASAALWAAEGQLEKGRKQFIETRKYLESAIQATEDIRKKVELQNVLATTFIAEGLPKEAIAQLQKGARLTKDPGVRSTTLNMVGGLLMMQGQMSEARTVLQRALELAPDADAKSQALMGFGELAQRQGDISGALSKFAEAFRIGGSLNQQSFALFKCGVMLMSLTQFDEALACFHKAALLTKSGSRKARALNNIGVILRHRGDLQGAKAKFKEALSYTTRASIKKQCLQNLRPLVAGEYIESLKAAADILYPPSKEPDVSSTAPSIAATAKQVPISPEATKFYEAMKRNDIAQVKLLLEGGIDVDARGRQGCTPLYFAAQEGLTAFAELLLAKGADVNAKTMLGTTPLYVASG